MAKIIGRVKWDLLSYQAEQKRSVAKRRAEKKWGKENSIASKIAGKKNITSGHGREDWRAEKRAKLEATRQRASKILGLSS